VKDLIELVDVVAALEEWPATEQFGEDTTDGPDVDYSSWVRDVIRGLWL
jgi:hypothetical protein